MREQGQDTQYCTLILNKHTYADISLMKSVTHEFGRPLFPSNLRVCSVLNPQLQDILRALTLQSYSRS